MRNTGGWRGTDTLSGSQIWSRRHDVLVNHTTETVATLDTSLGPTPATMPVRCINWILVHAALSYLWSTPPRRSRRIKVGLCESVGFSAADFPFAGLRRFWVNGLYALALAACTGLLTAHPHAPANRIDAPHTLRSTTSLTTSFG